MVINEVEVYKTMKIKDTQKSEIFGALATSQVATGFQVQENFGKWKFSVQRIIDSLSFQIPINLEFEGIQKWQIQ